MGAVTTATTAGVSDSGLVDELIENGVDVTPWQLPEISYPFTAVSAISVPSPPRILLKKGRETRHQPKYVSARSHNLMHVPRSCFQLRIKARTYMTSSLSPTTACALLYTSVFTLHFAVTTLPDAAQARSERDAFVAVVVRVHPASHCMIATDMYVRQRFL